MHIVPEQSGPARQAIARPLPVPPLPWRRGRVVMPRLHLASARDAGPAAPLISYAAEWPASQLWAHTDEAAFLGRIAEVVDLVATRIAALPPRLAAGPLGCATAHNVAEFRALGQADRAWRLAARLILRADEDAQPGCQATLDLSVSAYLLAVHEGGCVLAALEGAAVIDRLLAAFETMPPRYPGLRLRGEALTAHLRRRRSALLERAVAGADTAPGSKASSGALMSRAPWLSRPRD